MRALLLAAALAGAPARAQAPAANAKTYGVLLLAYDLDVKWRQELGSLRSQLKGHAVESVDSASDAISVQRAADRLNGQHVDKIVAVPLETVSASTRLEMTRYMLGVRENPVLDRPGASSGDLADKAPKPLKAPSKSALKLPADQDRGLSLPVSGGASTLKRVTSAAPIVVAPALDKSPLLVAMLADRAKALTPTPARESLVLAGIGPRNDDAMKDWLVDAQAVASQVGAKAGFRKAVAVAVRDGVRAGQQDKDRSDLQRTFRGLLREGRVCVVPLSPEANRVQELLKKALGGFYAYRWNGQGIQGDRRLLDWIKAAAEASASLPDGRQFNDGAPRAPGGRR